MFDIGLTEVLMVFVVMLLVVGPERLPRLARTAGLWLGRLRGFVATVKADIDRELAAEELKKTLARQAALPELEELIDEVSGKPLQPGESTGHSARMERAPDPQESPESGTDDSRR